MFQGPIPTPLFLPCCVQLGSHISELEPLTIGIVNVMYAESGNDERRDSCRWLASQADV